MSSTTVQPVIAMQNQSAARSDRLQKAGIFISRYGLTTVLLLIGALKFTADEAKGIQPLVAHSPLMSWMYVVLSLRGASNFIGFFEIGTAISIALRPISARVSFFGSLGAVVTFLLTVSFIFSTPGAAHLEHGFPMLGGAGQFLVKDLVLLGASMWTAGEAYSATSRSTHRCSGCGNES